MIVGFSRILPASDPLRQRIVENVVILVAKKNLNMGDTLHVPEALFEEKQVPEGKTGLAIRDMATLQGCMLKRPLRQGEFVTPDDLWRDSPKTAVG